MTRPIIYIDGKEGTTGLQIYERLGERDDIELILIDEDKRKDVEERRKLLNAADLVFLCLPDAAAREAVSLIANERTRIIDCSTAHRTAEGWTYGFPELFGQREKIAGAKRVANPGCHATGFISIVQPLVAAGTIARDAALTCFSLTKKIAASEYEFSYAQLEGVNFEYNKEPVEIKDDGVIFRDLEEDEEGNLTPVEGTEKLYPSDSVIISISHGPRNRIVSTTEGLKANEKGLLVADETGHTSRPGIFASGDVVNGARTVVEAVAHSKVVAESMHQYMQSLSKDKA